MLKFFVINQWLAYKGIFDVLFFVNQWVFFL